MGIKPRKWWVAGLLSLLEPGLGQIYNGQAQKGILFIVLPLFIFPLMPLCINNSKILYFILTFALLTVAYYLIAIGDAIHNALKLKADYNLKKYNKLIVYFGVIAIVFIVNTAVSGFVKNNYVQAYKIPAASNEPTLLVGDHILADRRVSARHPKRGDLIIFEFPEDPKKDFVKRVVALGGDTVEIRDKILLINNEPLTEKYVIHKEKTLFSADQNPRDNFGPLTVPANTCFVLGDNRDQSYDSRFWGVVENSKIKGTVKNIYWSWDHKKNAVRWDRIRKIIK